jgi:hypothetical protein
MSKKNPMLFSKQAQAEKIDSVANLVDVSLKLGSSFYFRGHADISWKLIPKIARLDTIKHAGKPIPIHDLPQQELLLLHRFRRHTYEQRGRILSEWEALFLARHHALPVRLLDWSSNPLVALYFAADHGSAEDGRRDGAIWWFKRPYRKMYVDVFSDRKPFEYHGIQMVFPFYPTMRMTAQSGLFTIHSPEWWDDLRTMSVEEKENRERESAGFGKAATIDIEDGGRWVVPAKAKARILEELERFGINARTLFPELDGLARGLVQTERFRSKDEYPQ